MIFLLFSDDFCNPQIMSLLKFLNWRQHKNPGNVLIICKNELNLDLLYLLRGILDIKKYITKCAAAYRKIH